MQLEILQAKYDQLLEKHERTTHQLQRAARVERQRVKSARMIAIKQSQEGELQNLLRSLLVRVRTKLADATGETRHKWIHGAACTRPHTAQGASTGNDRASARPLSVVNRPFSGRKDSCNEPGQVGLRCGKSMRPISSPNWGRRNSGIFGTGALKTVREGQMGVQRPTSAIISSGGRHLSSQNSALGVQLTERGQDELIGELMQQEKILELLKSAISQPDGTDVSVGKTNLAEDDGEDEVLNDDGFWVACNHSG